MAKAFFWDDDILGISSQVSEVKSYNSLYFGQLCQIQVKNWLTCIVFQYGYQQFEKFEKPQVFILE